MAALRAKTMQRMTSTNLIPSELQSKAGGKTFVCHPGITEVFSKMARKKPINAKGIAKIVCENLMRLKYDFTLVMQMSNEL